jgi:hypothetical protein
MALAGKFHTDRLDREQGIVKTRAAEKPRKPRLRDELEAVVKDTIEQEAEPAEREALLRALSEQLEEDDAEGNLEQSSLVELVAWHCRQLGFGPKVEFREENGEITEVYTVESPPISPGYEGPPPFVREMKLPYSVSQREAEARIERWRKKRRSG